MDKHKLILPVSILSGCIILGGFFYASQVSKQESIERQQEIKLQEDRRAEQAKAEQKNQEQLVKELKEQGMKEQSGQALDTCIVNARIKKNTSIEYWGAYMEKTCVGQSPSGESYCLKQVSDEFDKAKAEEIQDKDNCFKRYPQ